MLARSLATQFGALVGDERAEDRRGNARRCLKSPSELRIPLEAERAPRRSPTPADSSAFGAALVLGHGAGAGQRSAFMVDFARAISALGVDVVTFNFPYTEQSRRIPDRAPVLEACYRAVMMLRARSAPAAAQARSVHRRQVDGRENRHAGRGR